MKKTEEKHIDEEAQLEKEKDQYVEEVLESSKGAFNLFNIGIVVHELAHYLGALIVEAKVSKIVLLSSHGGLVRHRHVTGMKSFIIALMPFLIGNLLAFVLLSDAIRAFTGNNAPYGLLALWLGASIALYSEPSRHDLTSAWHFAEEMWHKSSTAKKIFLLIIMPFIYLLLIAMEVKLKLFSGKVGGLVWILVSFVIARSYVAALG